MTEISFEWDSLTDMERVLCVRYLRIAFKEPRTIQDTRMALQLDSELGDMARHVPDIVPIETIRRLANEAR